LERSRRSESSVARADFCAAARAERRAPPLAGLSGWRERSMRGLNPRHVVISRTLAQFVTRELAAVEEFGGAGGHWRRGAGGPLRGALRGACPPGLGEFVASEALA